MGSPFLPNWPYDITVLKNYPALALNPQETGGQYHEFRETVGAVWWAKNALFNGSVWTQKNPALNSYAVVFSSTGTLQLWSAPAGASPITWAFVGTFTTTGTVATGSFNVKLYGAVGNGIVDDSAAINAAITAAPVGSQLFFPAGTYLCSLASIAARPDLQIIGSGTVIITGTANPLMNVTGYASGLSNEFSIEGITFAPSGASNNGLNLTGTSYNPGNVWGATLYNCNFLAPAASTGILCNVTNGAYPIFIDCDFAGNTSGGTGLSLAGVIDPLMIGCNFNNLEFPIIATHSSLTTNVTTNCIFQDCNILNTFAAGTAIQTTGVVGLYFFGGTMAGNGLPIINDTGSSSVLFKGCNIVTPGSAGHFLMNFTPGLNNPVGIEFEGCQFSHSTGTSISAYVGITGAAGNVYSGIKFKNNTINATGVVPQPTNMLSLQYFSTADVSGNVLVGFAPTGTLVAVANQTAVTAFNPLSIRNNTGWNPLGVLASPPAVAATGVYVVNNTGYDCLVAPTAATSITSVLVKGSNGTVFTATNPASPTTAPPILVPSGASIAVNFTGALTWQWFAL